jgi:ankyrin repeat protein
MGNYSWKALPCKDPFEATLRTAFLKKDIAIINEIPSQTINDIYINLYESHDDKYPIKIISLIQLCLYQNWFQALKILIEKGASLRITNNKLFNKETTLYTAISCKCSIKIIKLLIANGCDIEEYSPDYLNINNALDYYEKTPLHIAIIKHHTTAIKLFLKFNIDIESKVIIDYEDEETSLIPITPLEVASHSNNIIAFKLLINKGANINHSNFAEYSLIHFAAANLAIDILIYLKNINYDLNDPNILKIINLINEDHYAYDKIKLNKIKKILI